MKPVLTTLLVVLSLLASSYDVVRAADPGPLQDFCVAVKATDPAAVFVNGKFCKDPKLVAAEDFVFQGLRLSGNTSNPQNSKVITAFVDQFPGINTLGIAMARLDFGLDGINPPHIHHRGTEMLVVVEGTLYVGFVASNQLDNRFFAKVLNKGDVFVFPKGTIHFQLNVGQTDAHAFAFLSSQNPGLITIANNVFGAKPPISADVLTKAFQVDKNLINYLQRQTWFDNH